MIVKPKAYESSAFQEGLATARNVFAAPALPREVINFLERAEESEMISRQLEWKCCHHAAGMSAGGWRGPTLVSDVLMHCEDLKLG